MLLWQCTYAPCHACRAGDDFVMLVMEVLDVDHLQLFSNRRKLYKQQEGAWTEEEVNP